MTTTAIDPTAAPLQFTTGERPGRGGDESGLRPARWSSPRRPGRAGRFWRFLTEPRPAARHAAFFTPYGQHRVDQPRPWC